MDVGQLDAISAVLGAIAASAGAGAGDAVKDMTKTSVTGTRDRLIALLRGRLRTDPVGDAKLTIYAAEPTINNGQALEGHLLAATIERDPAILTLARELLDAAGPSVMAPGSVAAAFIKQVNKDGGTGFIGGVHDHHYGTPALHQVSWELFRRGSSTLELRNTGTITANDVTVDANVDLAWPTPVDRDLPPGSSVMFIYECVLSDPPLVVTVAYSALGAARRHQWLCRLTE